MLLPPNTNPWMVLSLAFDLEHDVSIDIGDCEVALCYGQERFLTMVRSTGYGAQYCGLITATGFATLTVAMPALRYQVNFASASEPPPKTHTLSILGFIRKLISFLFRSLGLGDFLEPDIAWPVRPDYSSEPHSVSAVLIRELLPVVKFSDLVDPPESCAVCLYEFDGGDEIRRLTNCRHIFHRSCLDRWMDHDQRTCPLCRTQFIPDDFQDAFNDRLWAASGILDYYGEYSPITTGL
ncbi:unnamed protein product [Camellia sinensis]